MSDRVLGYATAMLWVLYWILLVGMGVMMTGLGALLWAGAFS